MWVLKQSSLLSLTDPVSISCFISPSTCRVVVFFTQQILWQGVGFFWFIIYKFQSKLTDKLEFCFGVNENSVGVCPYNLWGGRTFVTVE